MTRLTIDFSASRIKDSPSNWKVTPEMIQSTVNLRFWGLLLKRWSAEQNMPANGDRFKTWLKDTWSIALLTDSTVYNGGISGLEIDEEYYLMVLLKYPAKSYAPA